MKGKILFIAGLGVGYVLGTRAGRERYEQIKAAARGLWNAPVVQRQVDTVQGFVKEKAPDVVDFVADSAKKVAAQVSGRESSAAARSSSNRATASASTGTKKQASAQKKPASGAGA